MTVAEITGMSVETRRASAAAWRRRARVIHGLRVALPAMIVVIFAGIGATIVHHSLTGGPRTGEESEAPIRLVNPRFVGRDDQGRSFVLTAATATRDDDDYQRVLLDSPAVILDESGADPMRITAGSGVYHEGTRRLQMEGGVTLSSKDQTFNTATSLYNTATGELSGSGPIQGVGSLGEIAAKSYGVYDKGGRMVFKGGVRARIPTH
jgi:lipopolysaccharide export system protein LptC